MIASSSRDSSPKSSKIYAVRMSISAGISAIVPNVYFTDSASFAADRYLSADFSAVYAAISLKRLPVFLRFDNPNTGNLPKRCQTAGLFPAHIS